MEVNSIIKKCDFCKKEASSLCFQCMLYYCDTCYKIAHNEEENKLHKKEKIDFFVPMDIKCPENPNVRISLFCINEKGKIIFL